MGKTLKEMAEDKIKTFNHDLIAERRQALDLSLSDLAFEVTTRLRSLGGIGATRKTSISHETIRAWEAGRAFPRVHILPVLADCLGVKSLARFFV